MYVCICMFVYIHIIHVCQVTYVCTCMYLYVLCKCFYVRRMYVQIKGLLSNISEVCMYVCMYVMYVCRTPRKEDSRSKLRPVGRRSDNPGRASPSYGRKPAVATKSTGARTGSSDRLPSSSHSGWNIHTHTIMYVCACIVVRIFLLYVMYCMYVYICVCMYCSVYMFIVCI